MNNEFFEVFNKYKNKLFDYKTHSYFESIYRFLAILIFPLSKKLQPNLISIISLLLGIFAFVIFGKNNSTELNILMLYFIFSFILDFLDGMVARSQNTSSFHGKFIDGLFDIIVFSLLHIIFLQKILESNINLFHLSFYLVVLFLLPIQHLILDRYSALARWINEINNKKLQPYLRNFFFGTTTKILFDIQHLCVWLILFNLFDFHLIIEVFFLLSLISSVLSISIYLYSSKKFFSFESNQHDNDI